MVMGESRRPYNRTCDIVWVGLGGGVRKGVSYGVKFKI